MVAVGREETAALLLLAMEKKLGLDVFVEASSNYHVRLQRSVHRKMPHEVHYISREVTRRDQ